MEVSKVLCQLTHLCMSVTKYIHISFEICTATLSLVI